MNPKVQDFKGLIRWIADKHHGGKVHPIHARLGVSPALVQLWATGGVKNPSIDNIERLATVYSLDFWFVRGLLKRVRQATPIAGGSDADGTPVLAHLLDTVPLIRNWVQQWASALQPQWSTA